MEENIPLNNDQAANPANNTTPFGDVSWAGQANTELRRLQEAVMSIRQEMLKVIVGQSKMIDLLLAAVLSGGHVLLEGVPGIAKTMTAKMLAKSIDAAFSRIQFTPDLMPSDVLGTSVFNMKTSEFNFNKGPIFSNIILIDEINRSPAKTQAALFEVMEERQVTIDGQTYPMSYPFFVIATQNPIEQEGTYRLPEAQLDRFLFRIKMHYPSLEEEVQILQRFRSDFEMKSTEEVKAVFNAEDMRRCKSAIEQVTISDELILYVARIIEQSRHHGDLFLGASPRASLAILRTSKAFAAMNGRNFVSPDDIKTVAYPVLNHRIILTPEREMEGSTTEDVIKEILDRTEVPR